MRKLSRDGNGCILVPLLLRLLPFLPLHPSLSLPSPTHTLMVLSTDPETMYSSSKSTAQTPPVCALNSFLRNMSMGEIMSHTATVVSCPCPCKGTVMVHKMKEILSHAGAIKFMTPKPRSIIVKIFGDSNMKILSTTLHPQDIVPCLLIRLQCGTQLCWTVHRLATHKHLRLHCLYNYAAC